MKNWSIPVLTYHALHAPGWDYHENDHVALEQDLEILASLDFRVIPLTHLVHLVAGDSETADAGGKLVALTFDDGTDLDYHDFSHPEYGHLKSMRRILKEAQDLGLNGGPPTATSFVIASAQAREELDRTCIAGRGQWRDDWWLDSARNGPLSIANHSWDHTHESLTELAVDAAHRGRFDTIKDFETADAEILQAEQYIREKTDGHSSPYFAYPYGHSNDFLANEYFPAREDWFRAAFTTAGRPVRASDSRWLIPRFVCGDHWKSPEGLMEILKGD